MTNKDPTRDHEATTITFRFNEWLRSITLYKSIEFNIFTHIKPAVGAAIATDTSTAIKYKSMEWNFNTVNDAERGEWLIYFLHITSVLYFYIDVALTLSIDLLISSLHVRNQLPPQVTVITTTCSPFTNMV